MKLIMYLALLLMSASLQAMEVACVPHTPCGQCPVAAQQVGNAIHFYENGPRVNIKDSKNLLTHTYDPRHTERPCIIAVGQDFINAVDKGNLKAVKSIFEPSWLDWVTSWSNCRTRLVEGLKHATSNPVHVSGPIVEYLLTKVKPSDIERPDCLLNSGMFHGHVAVVRFINAHFPELGPWALYEAIERDKNNHVVTLLKGGIDPNKGIGTDNKDYVIIHRKSKTGPAKTFAPGAHNPVHLAAFTGKSAILKTLIKYGGCAQAKTATGLKPLDVALRAFKTDDTQDMLNHRLYIVRTLLSNMTVNSIPDLEDLDMSRIDDAPRHKVVALIKKHKEKPAPRITMCEQASNQRTQNADCLKDDSCNCSCGQAVFCACVLAPMSVLASIHFFCNKLRFN